MRLEGNDLWKIMSKKFGLWKSRFEMLTLKNSNQPEVNHG
jgi:hypothetical protein